MNYEDIKKNDVVFVGNEMKVVQSKDIESGGCYIYFTDGTWWIGNLDEITKIGTKIDDLHTTTKTDKNINKSKIKEFNLDLLEELKNCINCMISERIKYDCFETNEKRKENNKINLKKDYQLLEIIINKLNKK